MYVIHACRTRTTAPHPSISQAYHLDVQVKPQTITLHLDHRHIPVLIDHHQACTMLREQSVVGKRRGPKNLLATTGE